MIYLASDHAGFELKNILYKYLLEKGYAAQDVGPNVYIETDDYPDFIIPACEKAAKVESDLAIVLGGSGQGEAICANKVKGIRAALYYGGKEEILTLSKEHNNANVLSLGARFLTEEEAKKAVDLWLGTKFNLEERHKRRIQKIADYEKR